MSSPEQDFLRLFEVFEPNIIIVDEPIRVENLKLNPLASPHRPEDWQKVEGIVAGLLPDCSLVIPEYFTPEYEQTDNQHPLTRVATSGYFERLEFFYKLAQVSKGKKVWVIDPAYNQDFIALRLMLKSIENLPLSPFLVSLFQKLEANENYVINRRRFLVNSTILFLGLTTFGLGENPRPPLDKIDLASVIEDDFRRVIVAKNLTLLGEECIQESALLVYPPSHWEKIKWFLKHGDEREKRYDFYRHNFPFCKFPSFFRLRSYQVLCDGWQRVDDIQK